MEDHLPGMTGVPILQRLGGEGKLPHSGQGVRATVFQMSMFYLLFQ